MKEITTATFRDTFLELDEPVQVRRYKEVVGTYYPTGTDTPQVKAQFESTTAAAETTGHTFSSRPFTPAPKPGKKK